MYVDVKTLTGGLDAHANIFTMPSNFTELLWPYVTLHFPSHLSLQGTCRQWASTSWRGYWPKIPI